MMFAYDGKSQNMGPILANQRKENIFLSSTESNPASTSEFRATTQRQRSLGFKLHPSKHKTFV